jgi:hypothetical protein
VLKLLALAALILTIVAGFRGDQNPYRNIAPTMVWVIAWVGLAYVSAFIGNIWALINPWNTIFESIEALRQGITGRGEFGLRLPYPEALGVWPAFLLLLALAWTELVYPNPAVPRTIACLALCYSVLTLAGMFLFGRDRWLERGEVFTAVFGTFARFAPIELRGGGDRHFWLRPFGAGLLDSGTVSNSMMAFVLLLLASVLYDGALATPEWGEFEATLAPDLSFFGDFKLLALLLRRLYRDQRADERGDGATRVAASHRARLRLHVGADRHRLSLRALFHVPADPGPIHHSARVRPLRLRLESVRHRGIPSRYRHR